MSPIDGVPGELHVLAARAAALADEVRTRAGEVRRHVRTGWTGPAADAYAGAATVEAARLDRCADGLDDLVAALRGHARGADRRLEEVAELFGAARTALEVSAGLLLGRGRATVSALDVTGGAGGVTAVTEDVHACGSALLATAGRVAGVVPELAALAAHPALGVAAALDPFGAARVAGAAAGAVAGPWGLVASAAGCARVGTGAHLAAEAYRVAETGAERLASIAWRAVAPAVVPAATGAAVLAAPVLAGSAAVAVALSASTWVVVRSAPVAAGAAARAAGLGARGDLDAGSATAVVTAAVDAAGARLAEDASAAGLAAQVQAARHPWLVREALTALPVAVGALVPEVVERVLAARSAVTGGADPVPDSVPEVAALLAVAAGAAGFLRQGEVRVTPAGPPRRASGAHDVVGLVDRLRPFAPPTTETATGPATGTYTPGRVRVDRLDGTDGRRWVVYLPPTQTWSTAGDRLPADGTANLRLAGGLDADALEAAREAMVRAGVRPDDPVLAVGYSQGGMTAAALAVDPRAVGDVRAVVTMGSPVSHVPLPPHVVVLSLENGGDLTPDVDGAVDPDRRNHVSVERAAPVDTSDPWSAHEIGAYADTARLVDASEHPSLVVWREQVAPFLDPRAEVVVQELSTLREEP